MNLWFADTFFFIAQLVPQDRQLHGDARTRGISQALTGDHHFTQAGFDVLMKP